MDEGAVTKVLLDRGELAGAEIGIVGQQDSDQSGRPSSSQNEPKQRSNGSTRFAYVRKPTEGIRNDDTVGERASQA